MSRSSTPLFDRLAARAAAHRAAQALAEAELAEGRWTEEPPSGVHLERATAHLGDQAEVPELHPGDTVRVRVRVDGAVEGRAVAVGRERDGRYEILSPVDPWVELDDLPQEGDAWVVEVVVDGPPGLQRILVGICDGTPRGVESWEDVEAVLHPDAVTSVLVRVVEG